MVLVSSISNFFTNKISHANKWLKKNTYLQEFSFMTKSRGLNSFLFDLSTHKSTLAYFFEKLHGNIIFVSIISDWHFIWLSPKRQSFGQLTSARIPGILIPECQNKIPLEFHSDKNGPPLYNYKEKTCSFPEWSQTLHCLNRC